MKIVLALLVAGIGAAAPASALTAASPPRVAFNTGLATSHPDVDTVSPDGTDLQNLTPGTPDFFTADMNPSWSPDGTRIVFDSHRDSNTSTEIYVMNADGSGQQRLTNDSGRADQIFNSQPLWSPRGGLIAFLKSHAGQSYELWVMRPDGSGQHALTADGNVKGDVSWSPDGSRLLYTRNEGPDSRIYTVALDGTPPTVLSPTGASDDYPVWSPGGSQVAFAAPALTVMNADGSGRHALTQIGAASPAWSPDGKQIAFTGYRSFPEYSGRFGIPGRQDVFVVHADGGNLRRLTGPFADDGLSGADGSRPSWWPDGSRLFFVSERYPGPFTTFVMNADGSCEKQFLADIVGAPDVQRPVWQPGGGLLPAITHCAELRVSASVEKSTVALNEPATWIFRIDNDGNLPATFARIEVGIGAGSGTVLETSAPRCESNGSSVVCPLPDLPPGGSETIQIQGSRPTAGSMHVDAEVFANELDTDATNNRASSEADVLPCSVVGTWGSDRLFGTPGPDKICALPGADTIYGGKGNDFIDAGSGDDRIYPGPGRDTVIAKGGNDIIEARDGERDWIDCGSQHDIAVVDRIDVTRHCEVVARPSS